MLTLTKTIPLPLAMTEEGVIRVGGTRVTLDTIVIAFQQGSSPEAIAEQYPSVELADIYATITYYLNHQAEVEEYLRVRRQQAEETRREMEAHYNPVGLRERLLARRANKLPASGDNPT